MAFVGLAISSDVLSDLSRMVKGFPLHDEFKSPPGPGVPPNLSSLVHVEFIFLRIPRFLFWICHIWLLASHAAANQFWFKKFYFSDSKTRTDAALSDMPIQVLTEAQEHAALITISSDLRVIMEDVGLRVGVQAIIAHNGFTTLARLMGLEDTKERLRAALASGFGLDAADDMTSRRDVADVLAVWELASKQSTREQELRAEHKVSGVLQPAAPLEVKAMRKAYETLHGKMEERLIPGRYFLGKKLEELQNNEPEVERLTDVTTREEGEEEFVFSELGKDGKLTIKKGAKKTTTPPADAEDLRTTYRVLTHAWLFANSRHPNRSWMLGFDADTYCKLADYVLGPKVMRLKATLDANKPDSGPCPSWACVLHYEYEIRKAAYELVRADALTMVAALAVAMRDTELRHLHFTTPFQFELTKKTGGGDGGKDKSKKQQQQQQHQQDKPKNDQAKKTKKNKTKDKAKDNNPPAKKLKERATKTPDGREICFGWNSKRGCSGCERVHVCQICFNEHTTMAHTD